MTQKVVQDDKDEKWDELCGRDVLVRDVFGAKSPGIIRRNYPNTMCCLKAYINHKMHLILQVFFTLNKNLYVNLCDKEQIDDVKMKFGLMA